MPSIATYRAAFALTLLHVVLLSTGFLILVDQFAFPEILRADASERLALFTKNSALIIPAYYMMGLSGLTQIGIAATFHRAFAKPHSTLLLVALIAGVGAGLFQMMGFMRWPIAVPYLAEQMAAATTAEGKANVALVEGLLNRYAGMVIGEHLGFLAQGFWTLLISAAILRGAVLSRVYGAVGAVLGVLLLAGALEQLGGVFEVVGTFSALASAAWLGWLVMCGLSLARTNADGVGPKFGVASFIGLVGLMGGLVLSSMG